MALVCNKSECTLGETGKCVLGHNPESCPDRLLSLGSSTTQISQIAGDPVLTTPESLEHLAGSFTLNLVQVEKLMRERYCKVIGILGSPGAGKTACLVSLYLLLAHDSLEGFNFRDSKSVMAFEEISRGARRWNDANFPEQFTSHTEISDERTPGFLHVRVNTKGSNKIIDLLLPDLPGEWSTSLIDSNRTDRLSFLKSCDCIWLVVNGEEVYNVNTRQYTNHRLSLLMQRISGFLGAIKPAITLIVTHNDRFPCDDSFFQKVEEVVNSNGHNFRIIKIASFSNDNHVPAGDGISTLIEDLVTSRFKGNSEFWPSCEEVPTDRQMLHYGRNNS